MKQKTVRFGLFLVYDRTHLHFFDFHPGWIRLEGRGWGRVDLVLLDGQLNTCFLFGQTEIRKKVNDFKIKIYHYGS